MFSISKIHVFLKQTNSFFRFCLVGIVNTAAGLTVILTLIHFAGAHYWEATMAGNTVGTLISFLLNRAFTFRSEVSITNSFPRFLALTFACFAFSYSLSSILARILFSHLHLFYLSEDTFAVLLGLVIYTLINYSGQKLFVFPEKGQN
ncbi:GtrA family protein [Bacillus massilinigeriensis]|uniref:GtrA family protein n=1 Tax=Bacillus mediterraneensis TaxID=1805474 RepID=UPI003D1600AA